MRLRFLLPQLLISCGVAFATGQLWLILIPLITGAILLGQSQKSSESEPIRVVGGRIWLGGQRLGQMPWLWNPAVRQRVLLSVLDSEGSQLSDCFERELRALDKSPLLGVGFSGAAVRLSELESLGHLLVVGSTGAGKTQLLRNLLPQLRGECWCADYKGGGGLLDIQMFSRSTTNLDAGREEFWKGASAELQEREQKQAKGFEPKALFLVVDELAAALAEPHAQRAIDAIARKGRGLSLHLLLAGQNLSGVTRSIWTNLHSRVVLAPTDLTEALQLGIDPALVKSLRPHEGVLRTPSQSAVFWFPPSAFYRREQISTTSQGNPLLDFSS